MNRVLWALFVVFCVLWAVGIVTSIKDCEGAGGVFLQRENVCIKAKVIQPRKP